MGPRSAALGGGPACEHPQWGLRWSPLMGPRSAALGGGPACEHPPWALQWSSLWGHETLHW
eukprot:4736923-Pyramimonas_sp.AAC.1